MHANAITRFNTKSSLNHSSSKLKVTFEDTRNGYPLVIVTLTVSDSDTLKSIDQKLLFFFCNNETHTFKVFVRRQNIKMVMFFKITSIIYRISNRYTLALQLLFPENTRELVISTCHDSLTSGHRDATPSIRRVQSRFSWYGMIRQIRSSDLAIYDNMFAIVYLHCLSDTCHFPQCLLKKLRWILWDLKP